MGFSPIDASFEDNSAMSELDGAQIYDALSRAKQPAKGRGAKPQAKREEQNTKAPVKREETRENRGNASARPAEKRGLPVRVDKEKNAPVKAEPRKLKKITLRDVGHGLRNIMSTKSDVRVKTLNNEKKKPLPVSALVMSLICTLLLMFMIVSYVQINEYTVAVSELRADITNLSEQDKELTLQLEKKNDMLVIEEKAGELGMVKVDQLTKKHISLAQEDKIEVIEPEPTEDSTVVTTIMSSIWQNFAGLWEYLG